MTRHDTMELLWRPETPELRYLPEGPMSLRGDRVSWVAIQHGSAATTGSLNILHLDTRLNQNFPLPGRPGFAIPTAEEGVFLVGLERHVVRFHTSTGECEQVSDEVDAAVSGTIINDGVAVPGGLVFGTKDLQFAEAKGALYFWRNSGSLFRLRGGQTCSNGKEYVLRDGVGLLYDIDSPTKTIVEYPLDLAKERMGEPRIVVDLRDGKVFPDGMVLTPDRQGLIVSLYNPHDAEAGETRQYGLDGKLQRVWLAPGSPRVTCPQLVEHHGRLRLVVTTAVEHMPPEQQAAHPNAGALFIADF